jgi:hypothetical protein
MYGYCDRYFHSLVASSLSRRWLLLLSLVPFGQAFPQVARAEHVHDRLFQDRHILLQPLTQQTLASLSDFKISEEQRTALGGIIPLSLTLTNVSGKAIVQVTVRYTSVPVGKAGRSRHFTMQLSSLGIDRRSAWIDSGRTVFLCPESRLSAMVSSGNVSTEQIKRSVTAIGRLFTSDWTVTVSLDSIAFEDGEVIGPDEFRVIEQQNESAKGRSDLLARALKQFTAGDAKLTGLSEWLKREESTYHGMNLDTGRPDYYRTAQLETARSLIALRGRLADGLFGDLLERSSNEANRSLQPGIKLRKVNPE